MGYQGIVPEPVRDGLGNALRNLSEPVNFLNFLLQFKIGKAAETLGRFAVNTTFGVGGLFDVAKTMPFNLPYRRNGFANTSIDRASFWARVCQYVYISVFSISLKKN